VEKRLTDEGQEDLPYTKRGGRQRREDVGRRSCRWQAAGLSARGGDAGAPPARVDSDVGGVSAHLAPEVQHSVERVLVDASERDRSDGRVLAADLARELRRCGNHLLAGGRDGERDVGAEAQGLVYAEQQGLARERRVGVLGLQANEHAPGLEQVLDRGRLFGPQVRRERERSARLSAAHADSSASEPMTTNWAPPLVISTRRVRSSGASSR